MSSFWSNILLLLSSYRIVWRQSPSLIPVTAAATTTPGIRKPPTKLPHDSLSQDQIHAQSIMDWVRTHGGYVSDKLEIRRRHGQNGPLGVFATGDIQEDEVLLHIPPHLYLKLDEEEVIGTELYLRDDVSRETIYQAYYANSCRLAHKLMNELEVYRTNASASHYAPFIAYLETQSPGQLPATYSPLGKELLRQISGKISLYSNVTTQHNGNNPPQLSPYYGAYQIPPWQLVDWIDDNHVAQGCFDATDSQSIHAAELIMQRGYDSELIPLWDMVNHDNGKLNVDTNSLRSEEGLKVWADLSIKAGDEIFASYNFCTDCLDVGDDWGTPGIFRDFGFVEDYPQIWPFLDRNVSFVVDYNEDNNQLQAYFDHEFNGHPEFGVPKADGFAFMKEQHQRLSKWNLDDALQQLCGRTTDPTGCRLPEHEYFAIQRYHNAIVTALAAGMEATRQYWMNLGPTQATKRYSTMTTVDHSVDATMSGWNPATAR